MRGSAGSDIVTISFLALALHQARMSSKGAGKSLAGAAPTWVRLTTAQGERERPAIGMWNLRRDGQGACSHIPQIPGSSPGPRSCLLVNRHVAMPRFRTRSTECCAAGWVRTQIDDCSARESTARLAQSAERKALNLVVVGSSPTVGVLLRVQLLFHGF